MHVIVDFCIVPVGVGVSLSDYIAECTRIIRAAGLKSQLHAYGTNIEGDWDEVMDVIKECHARATHHHDVEAGHTNRQDAVDGG